MGPSPLIVIFGASVRPDGTPSPALLRRIEAAWAAAEAHPDAPILCSGGGVGGRASEASVMVAALSARGVAPHRLFADDVSQVTLENVLAAARKARVGGHPFVMAVSDSYHLPRIRLLLRLHGVQSVAWPARFGPPLGHGLWMILREALAIPHNLALLLAKRARRAS